MRRWQDFKNQPPTPKRNNKAYRARSEALKAKTRREGLPCWICGGPFNWNADPLSSEGFTADHVIPVKDGGDIANGALEPAHRGCNSRRGNMKKPQQLKPLTITKRSRDWSKPRATDNSSA